MNGFYEFVNNPGVWMMFGIIVVEVLGLVVVAYWGDWIGGLKGVALGLLFRVRGERSWIRLHVEFGCVSGGSYYRALLLEEKLMHRYRMLRFWILHRRVSSRAERKAAIRKRRVAELHRRFVDKGVFRIVEDPEMINASVGWRLATAEEVHEMYFKIKK